MTREEIVDEAVERIENIVTHLLCHTQERRRQTRAVVLHALESASNAREEVDAPDKMGEGDGR